MRCKLQPDIVLKRCKRKTYFQRALHESIAGLKDWKWGKEPRSPSPQSPAIARRRSLKIGDVMGARGAQIPSIVIVAMVVILVLEEQADNEPRTSSHSLRSLLLRGIPCTMWRRGRPNSRP